MRVSRSWGILIITLGLFQAAWAQTVYQPYYFTTLAGAASQPGTNDGAGSAAQFDHPLGVAVDGAGNLFVADTFNHTIRQVSPAGVVTTLAGQPGVAGSADGTGSAAQFNHPSGVAVDGAGNVYVADTFNHTIRRVTAAGVVTTLAGSAGVAGISNGTGSAAQFNQPAGVAVDGAGNLFVADTYNHTIRRVTAAGVVTTLAGLAGTSGSADGLSGARFNQPTGVAVDGAGTVFVADTWNDAIRQVSPVGAVTTLAGHAGNWGAVDDTGSAARFSQPHGVAVDTNGNVFVADYGNYTIRKVTAAGMVTTVAGSAGDYGNVDGTGGAARFTQPAGVAVDHAGNLFVADTWNATLRKGWRVGVIGLSGSLAFGNVTTGTTSTATLTITNSGTAPVTVGSISYPNGFTGAWSGTLAAGGAHNVTVTFTPTAVTNYSGTVTVNSDTTNGVSTIAISGTGIPAPTVTITISANPTFGGSVTGGGPVNNGSNVIVTATPNPCYHFVNWTEGATVVSLSSTYQFTATADRTLVANFALNTYTIAGAVAPAGGGTVSGTGTVTCGSSVTMTATPSAGYNFVNWTDGGVVVSAAAQYTFSAAGNRSLVANFVGLTIATATVLPGGIVGVAYSNQFQAAGGFPAYKWGATGPLPAGLKLNATTGWLSGKPTAAGTNSFTVRVTDTAAQTIQKNFTLVVRDIFGPVAGTYNGLAIQTNAPAFNNSGAIKIVLSKTGTYAANLSLGGVATTFQGRFDDAGNATNTGTLRLVMKLDPTGQITGTVGTATLLANRAVFSSSKPCPWTGKYNCLLEPTTNLVSVPQGDGYATFTVVTGGSAALAGKLADGTALSLTLPVSASGTWPLYKLLYANKGAVLGWVSFTPSNVVAVVDWFKPPTSGRYSAGFNTVSALTGTKLTPPAGTGTWQLTLTAGDLASDVIRTVTVSSTGKVTLPPVDAYKLKLSVTPTTGKFTGSFVHPGNNQVTPFTGLFLQAPENDAGGFFLGPNTSGAVTLAP